MVCCGVATYIWAVVVLGLHRHISAETPAADTMQPSPTSCPSASAPSSTNTSLLDHIPEVVSLKEGKNFTYNYPCEEGVEELLCYYIHNETVQPRIFSLSDVNDLPPFLRKGITASNQECPTFPNSNITFTVTTSMSGLLMFYANSVCDITNSLGPPPVLFNITAAPATVCVQPSSISFKTASMPSQSTDTGHSSHDRLPQSSLVPSNSPNFTASIDSTVQGSLLQNSTMPTSSPTITVTINITASKGNPIQGSCDCSLQSSLTPSNSPGNTTSIDSAQGSENESIGLTITSAFLVAVTVLCIVLAIVIGVLCVQKYRDRNCQVHVAPGERRNLELGQTESSGYTIRNGAV